MLILTHQITISGYNWQFSYFYMNQLFSANTMAKTELLYPKNVGLGGIGSNRKNQILGAVLELPAKQRCQFGPILRSMVWIGSAV